MLLSYACRTVRVYATTCISLRLFVKAVQDMCAGNHDGMGNLRGNELLAACCILGVSNIHCLRVMFLPHLFMPIDDCR